MSGGEESDRYLRHDAQTGARTEVSYKEHDSAHLPCQATLGRPNKPFWPSDLNCADLNCAFIRETNVPGELSAENQDPRDGQRKAACWLL